MSNTFHMNNFFEDPVNFHDDDIKSKIDPPKNKTKIIQI